MRELDFCDNVYISPKRSVSFVARVMPSLHFWIRFVGIVLHSGFLARRGKYDSVAWQASSGEVFTYVENVGIDIRIEGIEHLRELEGPCVIIGNHMSLLETVLMPAIVLPTRSMTFVVKESLTRYPVFKDVIDVCKPVAISRTNPREDLKKVLDEGAKHLAAGTSVMIFPQATRSHIFDPRQMSTIGVKLAKKAGVPIVPLALKTDALKNGRILKDIGPLDTSIPIRFAFGTPFPVDGKGGQEHDWVVSFIGGKLQECGGGNYSSSSLSTRSGSSEKSSSSSS